VGSNVKDMVDIADNDGGAKALVSAPTPRSAFEPYRLSNTQVLVIASVGGIAKIKGIMTSLAAILQRRNLVASAVT
jgi:hypothetical protein